jgi:hypothetical protein
VERAWNIHKLPDFNILQYLAGLGLDFESGLTGFDQA